MERLTERSENGTAVYCHQTPEPEGWKENRHAVLERCCQYEDTGLTPEEIVDALALTDWIRVDERFPKREEWMGTDNKEHYLRRLEVAVASDTLEYFFVFYDGYKWFDKFGRTYAGVVAWKIHEPFHPQN